MATENGKSDIQTYGIKASQNLQLQLLYSLLSNNFFALSSSQGIDL